MKFTSTKFNGNLPSVSGEADRKTDERTWLRKQALLAAIGTNLKLFNGMSISNYGNIPIA
jgi:hypothetical protein